MNMESDDIVVERPVVSTVLVAAVATVVYVGIQVLIDGVVAPLETAIFVVVFTVVYVGGNWYLRKRAGEESGDGGDAGTDTPDDAA